MTTITFLAQLVLFLIISVFCFTLPGAALLNRIEKIGVWEKLVFGTVIGFVLFTLFSYLLLLLKVSYLIVPILLIADILLVKDFLFVLKRIKLPAKKQAVIVALLFLLGTLGQLAIIAPSGTIRNGDLIFWGSNGHDASWHIALTNEINSAFPLQNPVFAGERLVNYHFFSDIAPALFHKYLAFSSLDLYFRLFPFLYSLLLGATAYFLGKKLGKSFSAGVWTYFFTVFAGSFGYIVTLLQHRGIGGESLFWATQVQSSITNPPQIISNFLMLTFLFLFISFPAKPRLLLAIVIALIVGTLATFKVYAAVPVLTALGVTSIWRILKEKKYDLLAVAAGAGVVAAILYLPNTSSSATFLILQPWWFIRTMVVEPSRLNWVDLELRRQFYLARGGWKSFLRIVEYEGVAFLIFIFGNLGTRFLGLGEMFKMIRKFFSGYFNQVFITITVISLILPLLFLQKGVAGNTAQFLQYFILLFGVLAGLGVAKMLSKIKSVWAKTIIILGLIVLTIPTQIGPIYDYYSRSPFAKISDAELAALNFLKQNSQENEVVITAPYDKNLDFHQLTPDIWDWFDTSYVAAFTERRVYLADTEQVDIMGYDFESRLALQEQVFKSKTPGEVANLMKDSRISYLYFPKAERPAASFDEDFFQKIFSNDKIEIWKIK